MFFCDFGLILGVQGPPRGSSEDGAKQDTKRSAVSVHSGELFWSILGPKSDFCAFSANFYALFWHRFWEASGPNFEDLGVISGCLLESL